MFGNLSRCQAPRNRLLLLKRTNILSFALRGKCSCGTALILPSREQTAPVLEASTELLPRDHTVSVLIDSSHQSTQGRAQLSVLQSFWPLKPEELLDNDA